MAQRKGPKSPARPSATREVGESLVAPETPGSPLHKTGTPIAFPVTGGLRGALMRRAGGNTIDGGFTGRFFPPLNPLTPQAQTTAVGRRFNYQVGQNTQYTPRGQQGQSAISFDLLRRFADPTLGGPDIVRLLIERRKAQMKAQSFRIRGRDKKDDGGDRARTIEHVFRKPDGKRTWRQWLSSVLEDHFVIDAVAVYPVVIAGRPCFRQIDGATITVLIDDAGDTPVPPLPAYQQVLQSLPAVDYTSDELAYYADNQRVNRIYGMSPVEQMVGIITLAANRQLSLLNYFTSGSVPDMLVGVPDTWNPDQIAQFQEWWDSFLAGNLAERRHARFIPGATKPYETKSEVVREPWFDEWIVRLACFCFGISPQAFVKEMNRATSQTAKQTAAEEGLEPTKLFVKDLVDDLLERGNAADLQLAFDDEEIQDPAEKANYVVSLRGGSTGSAKPIITLDEARDMLDMAAASPDQLDELDPEPVAPPPGTGKDGALPAGGPVAVVPAPKTDDVKKAAASRGRGLLPPVPANRRLRKRVTTAVERIARAELARQKKIVASYFAARATKLAKASLEDLHALVDRLKEAPWDDDVRTKLKALIVTLARDRATAGLDHVADYIAGSDDEYRALLEQANAKAIRWADERVGNLVTAVDETTRKLINEMTATAIDEGMTNDDLSKTLTASFAFSPERSSMIARTETAFAESAGTLIGFRESGVVQGKEWFPDAEACEICIANAEQGVIGLDDDFDSGDDAPPAHPNCECTVLPVLDEAAIGAGEVDAEAA